MPELPPAPGTTDALSLMRQAGLKPDPVQEIVARTPGHQLVLAHRQRGKSTIAAAIALEDAYAHPGCLDLLVSRSMRQSGELYRKVKQFYHLASSGGHLVKDTEHEMELPNGSRIISLPASADTIVGYSSVHRLILEEAARIPDSTYYAVRPMLARSGGSILAITTPFGRRGWFYEAWTDTMSDGSGMDLATAERLLADLNFPIEEYSDQGVEVEASWDGADGSGFTWIKTFAPVTYCPQLSKAYIANERRSIPALWFNQEWLCEFVELGQVVFRYEDLQAMMSDEVVSLFDAQGRPIEDGRVVREDVQPLALKGWTH